MRELKTLLAIKRLRQTQAEQAVLRQRQVAVKADAARSAAKHTLQTYRSQAQQHEAALYRELYSQPVRVREIETVRQQVVSMHEQEQQHAQCLQDAEQNMQHQNQALVDARQYYQRTLRETQKTLSVVQMRIDAHAHIEAEKEDQEIQEAAAALRAYKGSKE